MNLSAITFFEDNLQHISMNISNGIEKFEPGTTFEKTINNIKDNNLKSIASATMNLSAITLFDENFKKLSINGSIEVAKLQPEPTFEKTNNDIKDNHLKIIA